MDEKGLGLRLQNARKAAGLTQQDLCQKADLSYSTLAKIERGAIKSPSIFTIKQIAFALGTSIDELLGIESGAPAGRVTKKRSKTGITFVYFDINGCLVRFYHRAFAAAAETLGISSDLVETAYWHYTDAVCRGDMTMDEFNGAMAARFHVGSFDWGEFYLHAIEPIAESHELVSWVHEHYRMGLLSNIMPGMIPEMMARNLLPNVPYDSVVDSSVVRAIKPEQAIYQIATEQAKTDPSQILLIDDSRTNLAAAEKEGWRVLWFDDYRPAESIERIQEALKF